MQWLRNRLSLHHPVDHRLASRITFLIRVSNTSPSKSKIVLISLNSINNSSSKWHHLLTTMATRCSRITHPSSNVTRLQTNKTSNSSTQASSYSPSISTRVTSDQCPSCHPKSKASSSRDLCINNNLKDSNTSSSNTCNHKVASSRKVGLDSQDQCISNSPKDSNIRCHRNNNCLQTIQRWQIEEVVCPSLPV